MLLSQCSQLQQLFRIYGFLGFGGLRLLGHVRFAGFTELMRLVGCIGLIRFTRCELGEFDLRLWPSPSLATPPSSPLGSLLARRGLRLRGFFGGSEVPGFRAFRVKSGVRCSRTLGFEPRDSWGQPWPFQRGKNRKRQGAFSTFAAFVLSVW